MRDRHAGSVYNLVEHLGWQPVLTFEETAKRIDFDAGVRSNVFERPMACVNRMPKVARQGVFRGRGEKTLVLHGEGVELSGDRLPLRLDLEQKLCPVANRWEFLMNSRSYCIDAICFRGSQRRRSLDAFCLPWHF